MATTALVPLSEWSMTYHPGCDHSEGCFEECDAESIDHRYARGRIRVHINADRFRVPGVTIVRGGKPPGRIIAMPDAGGIRLAEAAERSMTMPGVLRNRQDDEEDAGHRID